MGEDLPFFIDRRCIQKRQVQQRLCAGRKCDVHGDRGSVEEDGTHKDSSSCRELGPESWMCDKKTSSFSLGLIVPLDRRGDPHLQDIGQVSGIGKALLKSVELLLVLTISLKELFHCKLFF